MLYQRASNIVGTGNISVFFIKWLNEKTYMVFPITLLMLTPTSRRDRFTLKSTNVSQSCTAVPFPGTTGVVKELPVFVKCSYPFRRDSPNRWVPSSDGRGLVGLGVADFGFSSDGDCGVDPEPTKMSNM